MKVLPVVIFVILESQCFTFAIGEYKSYWERVFYNIKASKITQCQRPIYSRNCDGSPEVDNLEATFKEFRDVRGREVFADFSDGCGDGLIDVNL